MRINSDLS